MSEPGQFRCLRPLTARSPSVMNVIERLIGPFWARYRRSITVGGYRYACGCGHTHHAFLSCNHRLCPQCGAADTAESVEKQLGKLLPVPYFMVTFTLPGQLRTVMRGKRKAMELFFKCSSQALSDLLADPKP